MFCAVQSPQNWILKRPRSARTAQTDPGCGRTSRYGGRYFAQNSGRWMVRTDTDSGRIRERPNVRERPRTLKRQKLLEHTGSVRTAQTTSGCGRVAQYGRRCAPQSPGYGMVRTSQDSGPIRKRPEAREQSNGPERSKLREQQRILERPRIVKTAQPKAGTAQDAGRYGWRAAG